MRLFIQGDEEVAKRHLPIAKVKFSAFVARCKEAGLKQDRFTFFFEETGTTVFGQYWCGEENLQIYSPVRKTTTTERSTSDVSFETKPKVFYVNTAKGYYWVEVRYVDGVPAVTLTPFAAVVNDELVYPGFSLNAPGMIAGNFDDTAATRYVLAQNGGVIGAENETVGLVKSAAITDAASRITVIANTAAVHDFMIMRSDGGKTAEIRRVKISTAGIERFYSSIDMEYSGGFEIPAQSINPIPAWVHRKCTGSYYSPNKTIGYHVDTGTDDNYFGNLDEARGIDLLDNTGMAGESLFNHSQDLYRLLSLCCFPLLVTNDSVEILMASPTMGFADSKDSPKKSWGGYGIEQLWANCVDYAHDFNVWLVSPSLMRVNINFTTGEKTFEGIAAGGKFAGETSVSSWDASFNAKLFIDFEYAADSIYYNNDISDEPGSQCTWDESCSFNCDMLNGSTGICPKGLSLFQHWALYFRENIKNKKQIFFQFGYDTPTPSAPQLSNGYYFLFDGLWHLDVGNLWVSTELVGNSCGVCSYPVFQQDPGKNILFTVIGARPDWLMANGHEVVENLEVVSTLGWHPGPTGGSVFGFVAKVPEEFAVPHEPMVVKGGVQFKSPVVEGQITECHKYLYTDPCICADNTLSLNPLSQFELLKTRTVYISNGCPPFTWRGKGIKIDGKSYVVNDKRQMSVDVVDECSADIKITDACGITVSMQDVYSLVGTVTGPQSLLPDKVGYYFHNLGKDAVYTGSLQVLYIGNGFAALRMPGSASGIQTVSWIGRCAVTASMDVAPLPPCAVPYDFLASLGEWNPPPTPAYPDRIRIWDFPYRGGDKVFTRSNNLQDASSRWTDATMGVGWWQTSFATGIGVLIKTCIGIYPGTDHDPWFNTYFLTDETGC